MKCYVVILRLLLLWFTCVNSMIHVYKQGGYAKVNAWWSSDIVMTLLWHCYICLFELLQRHNAKWWQKMGRKHWITKDERLLWQEHLSMAFCLHCCLLTHLPALMASTILLLSACNKKGVLLFQRACSSVVGSVLCPFRRRSRTFWVI